MEFRVQRVVVSILLFSAVAAIPIPTRYDGFAFPQHSGNGPVLLEAFIDPLCIDCLTAWPTVTLLLEVYGPALLLIVHPFPAPFHHNSFFSARALHIAASLNISSTYPLLELIFKNQNSFLNDATEHESPADVVSRLVGLAADLGLSSDDFKAGFTESSTDEATRISFKYGCARTVTSTPTFLVNGIPVTADQTWSLREWQNILDPLISDGPSPASSRVGASYLPIKIPSQR